MLRALDSTFASRAHLAPTIVRIAVGVVVLAHAYAKARIFTFAGTEQYFAAHGFPGWTVYPVFLAELLGGLALIAGWHTRAVAVALVPVLLGALKPHVGNGWMFTNPGGGWEYVAVLLAGLVAIALGGGGAYALDRLRLPDRDAVLRQQLTRERVDQRRGAVPVEDRARGA